MPWPTVMVASIRLSVWMGEDRTGIVVPFIVPETYLVSVFFYKLNVSWLASSRKQDYDGKKTYI